MPNGPNAMLSQRDWDDFSALTGQESHTVEGQIRKMTMVEEMVRRRHEEKRQEMHTDLARSQVAEPSIGPTVDTLVQPIRIYRLTLSDGRFVLIVEKDGGPPPKSASHTSENGGTDERFNVMLFNHVDTVPPGAATELTREGNRLKGLGVYDMGAAVLNSISLITEVSVPRGMKLFAVFVPDEEEDSEGTMLLTDSWKEWPNVDCIVTSEIGPLEPDVEPNAPLKIITARAGKIKFHAEIVVNPEHRGHGALHRLPNATTAMRDLCSDLEHRLEGRRRKGEGYEGKRREHPLLGPEEVEWGEAHSTRSAGKTYSHPDHATFQMSTTLVPPSKLKEYETLFQEWATAFEQRDEWKGITVTFARDRKGTSYEPYDMPRDHPLVRIAELVIARVTGVAPVIAGAPSVADENVLADEMLKRAGAPSFADTTKGIINLPINGDLAHNVGEWVDEPEILRVRRVVEALLTAPDGLPSMIGGNKTTTSTDNE